MTSLRQMTIDEIRRSRATDPATSKEAARRAHGLAAEHANRIVAAMRAGGDRDWTPHEIAAACGLEPVQVCRRMHDLWVDGRVVESKVGDERVVRATPSGRPAGCWRAA